MLTLNQTIEIFDQFSFKHKMLGRNRSRNNFYFGDYPPETMLKGLAEYYSLWLTKLPTTPDLSGLVVRKFQVDISGKVNIDKTNEQHIISDTEQICFNLINYIEQVADGGKLGAFNIGSIGEITDYTEKRTDSVAGNYFTIELRSHQEATSCDLPIFTGSILNGNYIYVGGNYTPVTNDTMIATEFFIYNGSPIVLANTPTLDMLIVSNGNSEYYETNDYTRSNKTLTITNPVIANGEKIRVIYTHL